MTYTTRDYLNVVAPYLPPQLVSPGNLSCISRVAAILPPSSNFGFECRLGSPVSEVDLLVAVVASDGSRGAWAGRNSLAPIPQVVHSNAAWQRVQGILADWDRGALEAVHDTWLEFDMDSQSSSLPIPSFFFGFDDAVPQSHPELTATLIESLLGRALPRKRRERLEACHTQLPPGGMIFQVGVMLSRITEEIRLCTRGLKADGIIEYLESLNWPGSGGELRDHIQALRPLTDAIDLDITIADQVLPQVGLECTIKDGAAGRAKVKALLDHWSAAEICLPEKAEAIFRWLGYCTESSDRARWPDHLLKASAGLGPRVVSTFARTLNHVKVSYTPGRQVSAKAYLGVRHYWAQH